MRLAYVCTDPGVPVFGRKGCSIHVQEVLREFVRRNWEVQLFARRFDEPAPDDLDTVQTIPLGGLPRGLETASREQKLLGLNRKLQVALESHGPFDLVYERYALWSSTAMRYARELGVASLLEVNAPLIEESSRHRTIVAIDDARQVTAESFAAAGAVVGVSHAVAHYVRSFPHVDSQRVHVIPNGVDIATFADVRQQVMARLQSRVDGMRRADAPFTIGFVGSLRPWHGMDVLATAFRQFHATHENARLLIVGDGPARDEFERLLGENARQATEMTGSVPHDQVGKWMSEMDVAVAPYPYSDSREFYFSPLKVLEYMAAGIPIVASDLGDIPRILRRDVDALLVEPATVDGTNSIPATGFVEAWEFLYQHPALCKLLSRHAYQRACENFGWCHVVDQALGCCGAMSKRLPARAVRSAS